MPSLTPLLLAFALAGPEASPHLTPEDPPAPSEHRWRLHAETAPARLSLRSTEASRSHTFDLDVPGMVSIGFGRMLGHYAMVGARFGGRAGRSTLDGRIGNGPWRMHTAQGSGWLAPYVELRPLPDRRVQPFGLVEGSVGLFGLRRVTEAGPATEPHRSFSITASAGGRAGLHAFVLPRLSVDADLGLSRLWWFTWQASPARSPAEETPRPRNLQLAATLGLSGWW
jgi:hypothetical protein